MVSLSLWNSDAGSMRGLIPDPVIHHSDLILGTFGQKFLRKFNVHMFGTSRWGRGLFHLKIETILWFDFEYITHFFKSKKHWWYLCFLFRSWAILRCQLVFSFQHPFIILESIFLTFNNHFQAYFKHSSNL